MIITQSGFTEDGGIDNPHGTLTLAGLDDDGNSISGTDDSNDVGTAGTISSGVKGLTNSVTDVKGFNIVNGSTNSGSGGTVSATVVVTGLSKHENDLIALPAGSTQSFRIVITGISAGGSASVLDILRTVPASTSLFITIAGTDGQTSTISDPRTVRVTAR